MAAKKKRPARASGSFPVGRVQSGSRGPGKSVDMTPVDITHDDDTVWTMYPDSGVQVLRAEPIQVTQADGSVWVIYPDTGAQVMVQPPPERTYDPGVVAFEEGSTVRGRRKGRR